MSRSRSSAEEIQSLADAMLRNSLSGSVSSLPAYPKADKSAASTLTESSIYSASTNTDSIGTRGSLHSGGSPVPRGRAAGDSATTSRTRERLRQAERERDELRRALGEKKDKPTDTRHRIDKEREIAERLKRENGGGFTGLTAAEARLRVALLKKEALSVSTASTLTSTEGLYKKVCSTDLLFLIDTTGSMWSYINAAKDQVKSIMDDIKKTFFNEAEVRIAVVGYKDHGDDPNIEFLDFTTSSDEVRDFLGKLDAIGGADTPEDVLGGIRQALNASWKQPTRCIIHIADAPPHGRTLHDLGDGGDHYPNPGSEPHNLLHEPLLKQMIGLSINYALLRINSLTNKMAWTFFQAYHAAGGDCKLLKTNTYSSQADALVASRTSIRGGRNSFGSAKGGLLFEEAELGTSYSALRHLVVRSVTTSASRTAVRMSSGHDSTDSGGTKKRPGAPFLDSIGEDGDDESTTGSVLEPIPPRWDQPGWLDERLFVEGFSPDVVVHSAGTLNDMMAHDDNIKLSIMELTIRKRSKAFAEGALRTASYARTAFSSNNFVVKSFKKDGKRLAHLAEDMRVQALCKAFALEFNALTEGKHAIDFITTTCLKGRSGDSAGSECMSLEPYIDGDYVKYNNNCSYVNEELVDDTFNQAAQAFSHFTFERSWGKFLVCDLQGVGHVLTDPAIHTADRQRFKLADTNLGQDGFKFFFTTHVCNDICKQLELESDKEMVLNNTLKFRERWPTMDIVVCCSNKLCGKIVSSASANKSEEYPGYHWCDTCFPQLDSSTVRWVCLAPGTHHEYDVSKFFYESQGRVAPRKCPRHQERDATVSRTAVLGGNFWARLKTATKKKSINGRSW